MEKNQLITLEKIQKNLEIKGKNNVFPLTPTHRKELRQLRDANIGNLNERVRAIKKIKKEEYRKKYEKELIQKIEKEKSKMDILNEDWEFVIERIRKIIEKRIELEKDNYVEGWEVEHDYGDISTLKMTTKLAERKITINPEKISRIILEKQFNEKYNSAFDEITKRIDDIYTKYEEAINFGDLEIVKELYYLMKKSDSMFIKIADLKI